MKQMTAATTALVMMTMTMIDNNILINKVVDNEPVISEIPQEKQ